MKIWHYIRRIISFSRFVKEKEISKKSDKSYFEIIFHFMRLSRKKQFSFDEYYKYEFDKQSEEFIASFLSESEQSPLIRLLNPKKYYIIARNKYFAHLFLEKTGITKTDLYCYYHPEGRYVENDGIGYDYHSVRVILKSKNVESCVIKTTESSYGEGVIVIKKIDYREDDCYMHSFNERVIKLKEILKYEPLIFEQVIRQTAQFKGFNPTSVNTVRFMTTLYPDGNAYIIGTFVKIGRAGSCVDNAGAGGNIDVGVDIESGKIFKVTQFDGWRKTRSITHHPDTGALLEGVVIENWDSIKETVISFQKSMPFLKAVGWDIAITDKGPVVVELNDNWDTTGQLFIGRGWRNKIRECYYEWKKLVDAGLVSYWSGRGIDLAYIKLTKDKSKI